MVDNKYLNEEKYKKTEKRIKLIAIMILVAGLFIGGYLLYDGIIKPGTYNLEDLKAELETKKRELESKGVNYNVFSKYTDGETYDLKVITNALDPSFNHCAFDEYKNNSITKEYCAAKNSTRDFVSNSSAMSGIIICIATFMISTIVFIAAKSQQVMPIIKEGIEEIKSSSENEEKDISKKKENKNQLSMKNRRN